MKTDHQQVAGFILGLIKNAPMTCEESEAVSSAKQWLGLIATGQMEVSAIETPKLEPVPAHKIPRDPELPAGMP